jgi:hypothetical protein
MSILSSFVPRVDGDSSYAATIGSSDGRHKSDMLGSMSRWFSTARQTTRSVSSEVRMYLLEFSMYYKYCVICIL